MFRSRSRKANVVAWRAEWRAKTARAKEGRFLRVVLVPFSRKSPFSGSVVILLQLFAEEIWITSGPRHGLHKMLMLWLDVYSPSFWVLALGKDCPYSVFWIRCIFYFLWACTQFVAFQITVSRTTAQKFNTRMNERTIVVLRDASEDCYLLCP